MTKKTQLKGVLMLLLTAFIWGAAFVAQSVAMDSIGAFTFSCSRTILGVLVLLPFILVRDHISAKSMTGEQLAQRKATDKKNLIYGAILGVVFCAATNTQQFAFNYTESGKIAFITALYMFFVPLFGIFMKKKTPLLTWICVVFGFVGLFFLCMDPENMGAVNFGDVLSLICAVIFAVHILLIEKFAADVDGVKLSCVQFAVSAVLSGILMLIFEEPSFPAICAAALPIAYAGIMSCGIAYTFQIVGQKFTEATVASLIMCMESVFGVLCAAVILQEHLTARELLGCGIMFVAIVLSQVSEPLTQKWKEKHIKKNA